MATKNNNRSEIKKDKMRIKTNGKNKNKRINTRQEELKINILQINLNRCRLAHDLLNQFVYEQKIDIVIISEFLKADKNWITDKTEKAAMWLSGINGIKTNEEHAIIGNYYSGTSVEGITFITGHFNARSVACGSSVNNPRGNLLYEACMEMKLQPVITEGGCTFERNGRTSKIDIACTDNVTYEEIIDSKVIQTDSGSDHKYVAHRIRKEKDKKYIQREHRVWNVKTLDEGCLKSVVLRQPSLKQSVRPFVKRTSASKSSDFNSQELNHCRRPTRILLRSIRTYTTYERAPVIWIRTKRTLLKGAKRREEVPPFSQATRPTKIKLVYSFLSDSNKGKFKNALDTYVINSNEDEDELTMLYEEVGEYLRAVSIACNESIKRKSVGNTVSETNICKHTRKKLKYKIWDSKIAEWKQMCENLNNDIWGRPYKIIMKMIKNKTPPPSIGKDKATQILKTLFPGEEVEDLKEYEDKIETDERRNDVKYAAKKLKSNKAAGLDGIPPELIKWLTEKDTTRIKRLINSCLIKEDKEPSRSDTYRLLCIVDAWEKIIEYLIKMKLMEENNVTVSSQLSKYFLLCRLISDYGGHIRIVSLRVYERSEYTSLIFVGPEKGF
ncbi:uncharacterized protein LOC143186465 [Calliopsis andreniformis]|uniref:uncharacterized protein LOC143186465 n=1 Tax=Calliopsis andreniformis TaxID=337506 RepID=UPI003FCEA290